MAVPDQLTHTTQAGLYVMAEVKCSSGTLNDSNPKPRLRSCKGDRLLGGRAVISAGGRESPSWRR